MARVDLVGKPGTVDIGTQRSLCRVGNCRALQHHTLAQGKLGQGLDTREHISELRDARATGAHVPIAQVELGELLGILEGVAEVRAGAQVPEAHAGTGKAAQLGCICREVADVLDGVGLPIIEPGDARGTHAVKKVAQVGDFLRVPILQAVDVGELGVVLEEAREARSGHGDREGRHKGEVADEGVLEVGIVGEPIGGIDGLDGADDLDRLHAVARRLRCSSVHGAPGALAGQHAQPGQVVGGIAALGRLAADLGDVSRHRGVYHTDREDALIGIELPDHIGVGLEEVAQQRRVKEVGGRRGRRGGGTGGVAVHECRARADPGVGRLAVVGSHPGTVIHRVARHGWQVGAVETNLGTHRQQVESCAAIEDVDAGASREGHVPSGDIHVGEFGVVLEHPAERRRMGDVHLGAVEGGERRIVLEPLREVLRGDLALGHHAHDLRELDQRCAVHDLLPGLCRRRLRHDLGE